jgi:hypothetical protein
LVIPIPGRASRIRWLGVVEFGENADSMLDVIALEAGQTVTLIVVSSALVRNGNADILSIENPSE